MPLQVVRKINLLLSNFTNPQSISSADFGMNADSRIDPPITNLRPSAQSADSILRDDRSEKQSSNGHISASFLRAFAASRETFMPRLGIERMGPREGTKPRKTDEIPTKLPRRSVASTLAPARSFLICESAMTRLIQKVALPIKRAGHRLTFVIVDSGIIHGGAKVTTHRPSRRLVSLAPTHVT